MHLKNLALLKITEAGSDHFTSVRIAPLYDIVTTRVPPRLTRDRMALKLNGKDDRLRRTDFKALATTAGLKAGDAHAAIDDLVGRFTGALDVIALLPLVDSPGGEAAAQVRQIVSERIAAL
jgi:serine/threonine-protein kinase HipA